MELEWWGDVGKDLFMQELLLSVSFCFDKNWEDFILFLRSEWGWKVSGWLDLKRPFGMKCISA